MKESEQTDIISDDRRVGGVQMSATDRSSSLLPASTLSVTRLDATAALAVELATQDGMTRQRRLDLAQCACASRQTSE